MRFLRRRFIVLICLTISFKLHGVVDKMCQNVSKCVKSHDITLTLCALSYDMTITLNTLSHSVTIPRKNIRQKTNKGEIIGKKQPPRPLIRY